MIGHSYKKYSRGSAQTKTTVPQNTKYYLLHIKFHQISAREKTKFFFEYAEETDTVTVKDYRLTVCSPEVCSQYDFHIKYGTPRKEETIVIPWKRFPRTRDGISIPQLIRQIFGRIPKMVFL